MGSNLGTSRDVHRHDPAVARHIDQAGGLFTSFEQHLAAADAARSLLSHPGWAVLQELVAAEVAVIDRELDTDRPLDSRAAYAAKHGRRGGLRFAADSLLTLVERAESRLAEQRLKHEGDAESSPGGV